MIQWFLTTTAFKGACLAHNLALSCNQLDSNLSHFWVQEPERPGPRQAEPQANRAPLQPQSSNVPPAGGPSAAQGISSKPVPYPSGTGLTIMPLAQVLAGSQVCCCHHSPSPCSYACGRLHFVAVILPFT